MNPYLISGPVQICFSGGRTSGYMLNRILDANGGLPAHVHATFQNTGKEREQTLDFVQECGERWGVPITWLEWVAKSETGGFRRPDWKVVTHASASRKGEPFAALIKAKGYLPNVMHRICTANLKIRVGEAFMRSLGYDDWDSVMGIRADEPRRIAKMGAPGRDNSAGIPLLPLARAGVKKLQILSWWNGQPFDLQLDPAGDLGNCDLCYLKGRPKLVRAVRADRSLPVWWIDQEKAVGSLFLKGYVSYGDIVREADFRDRQIEIPEMDADDEIDDRIVDCMCGD